MREDAKSADSLGVRSGNEIRGGAQELTFDPISDPMAEEEIQAAKRPRGVHSGPPPVYPSVLELAQGSQTNEKRYESLLAAFQTKYGCNPQFVSRAPGRVNIIGEHVDYSGYGVLPMAIEQDVAIACRPNSTGEMRFSNVSADYQDHSCPASGFQIDRENIIWYGYVLCGFKGVIEELGIEKPVGVDMLVSGNIPPASGLSSSSALVCCAALTAVCANGVEFPSKKELAEMCARFERFIGTQGGGMDQAISFLGQPGKAMMIEFNPVRPSEVKVPCGYSFIISNTNIQAYKAAESNFNIRAAECHLAARVIAKMKGLNWRQDKKLIILSDSLELPLSEMSSVVSEFLHPGLYSREEICKILEISDLELITECLTEKSKDVPSFKLHDRAKHVYEEANRVYKFNETANSAAGDDSATAEKLGQLMDESHSSCNTLYECSCPELNQLVSLSKEGGALGSRLTGAGWGGCAVSLVKDDNVEAFLEKLKEGYYSNRSSNGVAPVADLSHSLFATQPGAGAGVCKLEE